ncbi:protein of unknown function [Hyphomicrobium sp. 1Nfss2.1]
MAEDLALGEGRASEVVRLQTGPSDHLVEFVSGREGKLPRSIWPVRLRREVDQP